MPLQINAIKAIIAVLLIMTLSALSFVGGYKVSQWRGDAQQLASTKNDISNLKKGFGDVVSQSNATQKAVDDNNQKTEQQMQDLLTKLGGQDDAFRKIMVDLGKVHVGSCSFTADNDGLYLRAYQGAFGFIRPATGSGSDAQARKAGGSYVGFTAPHTTLPDK